VDGYPFFARNITLSKNLFFTNSNITLKLSGNYCLAYYLYLNDIKVNMSQCVDLSKVARLGDNKLQIVLCSSNRNLLGPHHLKTFEQPLDVGP
jgi:hypothetical protein